MEKAMLSEHAPDAVARHAADHLAAEGLPDDPGVDVTLYCELAQGSGVEKLLRGVVPWARGCHDASM
jgi:hypothetical protein